MLPTGSGNTCQTLYTGNSINQFISLSNNKWCYYLFSRTKRLKWYWFMWLFYRKWNRLLMLTVFLRCKYILCTFLHNKHIQHKNFTLKAISIKSNHYKLNHISPVPSSANKQFSKMTFYHTLAILYKYTCNSVIYLIVCMWNVIK